MKISSNQTLLYLVVDSLKIASSRQPNTIWFNVTVTDINEIFKKAIQVRCIEAQEITKIPDFGVSTAMFSDPFGYLWMLHQVHKDVVYEDHVEFLKKKAQK